MPKEYSKDLYETLGKNRETTKDLKIGGNRQYHKAINN